MMFAEQLALSTGALNCNTHVITVVCVITSNQVTGLREDENVAATHVPIPMCMWACFDFAWCSFSTVVQVSLNRATIPQRLLHRVRAQCFHKHMAKADL